MGNHTVNTNKETDYREGAAGYQDTDILITCGSVHQGNRELIVNNNTARNQTPLFRPKNIVGETTEYVAVKAENTVEKERD